MKYKVSEHPNLANFPRLLVVIANEAKWNQAIATSVLCDYFASLHTARNDKLCFYTFGMLSKVMGFEAGSRNSLCLMLNPAFCTSFT